MTGALEAEEQKLKQFQMHQPAGTFVCDSNIYASVPAQELVTTYNARMAKDPSAARRHYDHIVSRAPFGRCPFCGQRDVHSLDHTLPKDAFGTLAIAPANLVPCCSRCNQLMGNQWGADLESKFFDPYSESCESFDWLRCEIVPGAPAQITFVVDCPAATHAVTVNRIQRQFRLLRLASLYAAETAALVGSTRALLARLFVRSGSAGVREQLLETAGSFALIRRNSWQRAYYYAAGNNDWFCGGGFDT